MIKFNVVYVLSFGLQKLEFTSFQKSLSSSFSPDEKYALVEQINKAAV